MNRFLKCILIICCASLFCSEAFSELPDEEGIDDVLDQFDAFKARWSKQPLCVRCTPEQSATRISQESSNFAGQVLGNFADVEFDLKTVVTTTAAYSEPVRIEPESCNALEPAEVVCSGVLMCEATLGENKSLGLNWELFKLGTDTTYTWGDQFGADQSYTLTVEPNIPTTVGKTCGSNLQDASEQCEEFFNTRVLPGFITMCQDFAKSKLKEYKVRWGAKRPPVDQDWPPYQDWYMPPLGSGLRR